MLVMKKGPRKHVPQHRDRLHIQEALRPFFKKNRTLGGKFLVTVIEEHQHRQPGKRIELHGQVMGVFSSGALPPRCSEADASW